MSGTEGPGSYEAGQAGYPGDGTRYGGVWKRFGARIIDGLLVGIPLAIILAIIPGIALGGFIATLITSLAGLAYYLAMETSQGATFGKQWLGMRVTSDSGASPITMDASFRRNWWLLLGILGGLPAIGWLLGLAQLAVVIAIAVTIGSDDRNQGFHDQMAHTLVIDKV